MVRMIRSGHPWIYAEALVPPPEPLPAGAVVEVVDFSGRFLARGLWDPGSPIAVRVFTREPGEVLGEALVRGRFLAAAERRAGILADGVTDACRLVHGEADFLPGVVCDRYGGVAVLRFDGDAAASLRPWVVRAAGAVPGIGRVLDRPFSRTRRSRGPASRGTAADEAPGLVVVRENGLTFEVDLGRGHKTGMYLDQRDNRALVRSLAGGRRTLDLFCYVGGFTVAAAAGGAGPSLSIDISKPALAAARRNLGLNGLSADERELVPADVFAWLESSESRRRTWDLIVLDPPSLAPNRSSVRAAVGAYRRLNAAVFRLAAPRALVLSCSCSSHVDEAVFRKTVLAAASDAGRRVEVVESRGAAPDHPVVSSFPEGNYLKALLLRIV
ncbi:MAG: class I SAM-dependent rRNA methyltransferase [Deltaproteobacteria bacterium]|nr:class I SAM-dependent rRNA methyltransferase [Deltaproteobacteria bacterium]